MERGVKGQTRSDAQRMWNFRVRGHVRGVRRLTVASALVDLADQEDGLLVHTHAVFVGPEQFLHVCL